MCALVTGVQTCALPICPAADGGGADLWRVLPRGEGRPHGRSVRQTAFGRRRNRRRRDPAELSRRQHQRHGLHVRGAAARPGADAEGLYPGGGDIEPAARLRHGRRSEEHTSELQSLMRISYAVFCLKKKTYTKATRRM